MWRHNGNHNQLHVKLLKDYPERLQVLILQQEVCGELTRMLLLMLGWQILTLHHSSFRKRKCSKEAWTGEDTELQQTYYERSTRYLYPIGFFYSGDMGKKCSVFHKHVAERLPIKTGERYENIISTIGCKFLFLIFKSALICVRGSWRHNLETIDEFELFGTWPGLSKTKIDMFIQVCRFTFR